jgi:HAD superfamily hydrolase (TIGR01490 family)
MRRAAFFDMDKTLLTVNTARLYVAHQWHQGKARRRDVAMVSWWLLRYALGVLDAETVARQLARPWAGVDEAAVRDETRAWVERAVLPTLSAAGLREVEARRRAGDLCVLLTSSTVYAATPVADAVGIAHVLASRLGVREGRFTGEIELPFCYREGKVAVAERWAAAHDVSLDASSFFTDSISDLPMLLRVGEPVVVNPDLRLGLEARRRGWPVQHWREVAPRRAAG